MNTQERIELLARLKGYLLRNDEELSAVKRMAVMQNPWFIPEFVDLAIENVAGEYMDSDKLSEWMNNYDETLPNAGKKVGIVMAGNIPLVGFHDFLCVFMSGHTAVIKPSSKDEVLLKHLVSKLAGWNKQVEKQVVFADNLKNCDAYIATGSNNSGRYFEYYFGRYPNIIRNNRTSVALLKGDESEENLGLLSDDMQQYFGLGCRNVTKVFVPEGYDFVPLLQALKKYDHFIDHHKYKNNYDYQLALHMLNSQYYMTNGSVILSENNFIFSPVSQVNYEYYADSVPDFNALENNDIQCVVGKDHTPFGKAQQPGLFDYADGIDTMKFLFSLK